MMFIENKYNLGDIVYLKTDTEQIARMVIEISVRPNGVIYSLAIGNTESSHYDIEISETKNILLTVTN